MPLPEGVLLRGLETHVDPRGAFTELFRQAWMTAVPFIQWNAVISQAHVLRGVHVHLNHHDYLTVLQGRALMGLCDLRPRSPTARLAVMVELTGQGLETLYIPPGVAHGFYFPEPSLHVYAVSEYWDPADELGCRFDDPGLGLAWPNRAPLLSPRDASLGPLSDLAGRIPDWRAGGPGRGQAEGAPVDFAIAR